MSPTPRGAYFLMLFISFLLTPDAVVQGGACCMGDQSCSNMTPVACAAAGGVPGALGVVCEALSDLDGDGFLDECDSDDDGDGVPDSSDACPAGDPAAAADDVSGRPLGDMNTDCIVDGSDIAGFVEQLLRE